MKYLPRFISERLRLWQVERQEGWDRRMLVSRIVAAGFTVSYDTVGHQRCQSCGEYFVVAVSELQHLEPAPGAKESGNVEERYLFAPCLRCCALHRTNRAGRISSVSDNGLIRDGRTLLTWLYEVEVAKQPYQAVCQRLGELALAEARHADALLRIRAERAALEGRRMILELPDGPAFRSLPPGHDEALATRK